MHSRIIQLTKEPVQRSDWITEDRYYDNFVGWIADYVSEIDERNHLENLNVWLGGIFQVNPTERIVTVKDKDAYFKARYDKFIEAATQCANASYEDFTSKCLGGLNMNVWKMNSMFNDKYAIYIDDNDEYAGMQPLDSFMRQVNEGDTFYVGNVFDYHF